MTRRIMLVGALALGAWGCDGAVGGGAPQDGAGGGPDGAPGGGVGGLSEGGAPVGPGGAGAPGLGDAPSHTCTPTAEVCDGLDNDCDGVADDNLICGCGDDDTCYGGPAGTAGIGACHMGRRDCDVSGEFWLECTGWVGPEREICDDGLDNDCDGVVDNGCAPPEPPAEARCLRVVPGTLEFGVVRRGEHASKRARIEACGQAAVTVSGLERGRLLGVPVTDEFQVTAQPQWPVTLSPGDPGLEVEVTYDPGLPGIDFGHFVVRNDSAEPELELKLSAEGRPPRVEDVSLHVQLEWDSDNSDVDLHLVRPGAQLFDCRGDCFYQNPSPDWGQRATLEDNPFLDVDNVKGFGPENINVTEPEPGVYRLTIHYYLDQYLDGAFSDPTSTNATVRVFVRGQLAYEATQHLDSTDRTWDVAEIQWPAGDVTPLGATYRYDRWEIPDCPRGMFGGG